MKKLHAVLFIILIASGVIFAEDIKVKTGDVVSREQTIGWSGGVKGRRGSGASTGAHLHFSIYLDMKDFIKWQIRVF